LDRAALHYLHALRRGDLHAALTSLVGAEAAALPAPVMRRARERWNRAHRGGLDGSLEELAGGVLELQCEPAEEAAGSVLVALFAAAGHERIVALGCGEGHSVASWSALLRGLRDRGFVAPSQLRIDPALLGAVGPAMEKAYPDASVEAGGIFPYTKIDRSGA
jgi:hypothetical protein